MKWRKERNTIFKDTIENKTYKTPENHSATNLLSVSSSIKPLLYKS